MRWDTFSRSQLDNRYSGVYMRLFTLILLTVMSVFILNPLMIKADGNHKMHGWSEFIINTYLDPTEPVTLQETLNLYEEQNLVLRKFGSVVDFDYAMYGFQASRSEVDKSIESIDDLNKFSQDSWKMTFKSCKAVDKPLTGRIYEANLSNKITDSSEMITEIIGYTETLTFKNFFYKMKTDDSNKIIFDLYTMTELQKLGFDNMSKKLGNLTLDSNSKTLVMSFQNPLFINDPISFCGK